jgi:DNA excision repair protein ERCC-4
MATLLEFENQIYHDMFENDGLLILAEGLGIERIFMNFIKLFCDPSHLVMILNTHEAEEQYFISKLKEFKDKEEADDFILPIKITTETHSMNERSQAYLQGGCFFVTSRYQQQKNQMLRQSK